MTVHVQYISRTQHDDTSRRTIPGWGCNSITQCKVVIEGYVDNLITILPIGAVSSVFIIVDERGAKIEGAAAYRNGVSGHHIFHIAREEVGIVQVSACRPGHAATIRTGVGSVDLSPLHLDDQ